MKLKLAGAAAMASALLLGAAQVQAQTPAPTIRITSPSANATVNGPVSLTVDIQNANIRPASEGDPQAFHYHALIDVDPATVSQPGQPLPSGRQDIIHTADLTIPLGNLAPGQHTVTVILTRTDHVPLATNLQDRITFTVGAGTGGAAPAGQATPAASTPGQPQAAAPTTGQPATALPATGTGGLYGSDTVNTRVALLAAVVLAVAATGLVIRTRRA